MASKQDDNTQTELENVPQCLTPHVNAAIIPALFSAENQEKEQARETILVQIGIVSIATGVAYCLEGAPQLWIAVLTGGGVSILNGVLLAWRMARAVKYTALDAHQQLRLLYFYAAERFMVVIAMLVIFMAVLKLSALWVLVGFIMGQAALIVSRLLLKFKTEGSN